MPEPAFRTRALAASSELLTDASPNCQADVTELRATLRLLLIPHINDSHVAALKAACSPARPFLSIYSVSLTSSVCLSRVKGLHLIRPFFGHRVSLCSSDWLWTPQAGLKLKASFLGLPPESCTTMPSLDPSYWWEPCSDIKWQWGKAQKGQNQTDFYSRLTLEIIC